MKTEYSQDDVRQFLQTTEHANPDSIEQLDEGHLSQALSFETADRQKLVLRIASNNQDFLHDQYAYQTYHTLVPIPRVLDIGHFNRDSYYCISEWVQGTPSNKLNAKEMEAALGSAQDIFAKVFLADITSTTGYGEVDVRTGNGPSYTWRAALEGWRASIGDKDDKSKFDTLRGHTQNIGLDSRLVNEFLVQFDTNLSFASEVRRLFLGDPGFDNLLIHEGRVSAVLDWAEMGYGDWMRDFARLDFWWPNRFGDIEGFATKYDLGREHLVERKALYWAVNALSTIEFASSNKNEKIASWLREHVASKLV